MLDFNKDKIYLQINKKFKFKRIESKFRINKIEKFIEKSNFLSIISGGKNALLWRPDFTFRVPLSDVPDRPFR